MVVVPIKLLTVSSIQIHVHMTSKTLDPEYSIEKQNIFFRNKYLLIHIFFAVKFCIRYTYFCVFSRDDY